MIGKSLVFLFMCALAVAGAAPATAERGASDKVLSVTPVDAPIGTLVAGRRIANGDGDTAGKCLSISHNGAGPHVLMEACNNTQHQDWMYRFYTVRQDINRAWNVVAIWSLHPSHRGKCITGAPEGQQVYLATCTAETTSLNLKQFWYYDNPIGGQWAQFGNFGYWYDTLQTYWCLDVRANGLNSAVQTWRCKDPTTQGLANQLWKVF